jgi:hypothetical protein
MHAADWSQPAEPEEPANRWWIVAGIASLMTASVLGSEPQNRKRRRFNFRLEDDSNTRAADEFNDADYLDFGELCEEMSIGSLEKS